jgi:hypothetical protein
MGVYTSYNQSWVDAQIVSKLKIVVNTILDDVQGVKSIVLTGGFGRGEGSIQIYDTREIRLLKDFDLVVIVDRQPAQQIQAQVLDKIYRQLNLKNAEFEQFRFSQFVVDIKYMSEKDLAYPDIWFYDLKSASKVLYGRPIANLIPYNANDIPPSSGFRILFEKVTGLLGHFPYRYFGELNNNSDNSNIIDHHEQDLLIYECLKSYIEMCTALCILTKHYRPSYYERMEVIKQIYSRELADLAEQFPQLPELVERATLFKLKPDPSLLSKIYGDPLNLWFTTRDHLGIVIRYYLSRYTGRDIRDWADLIKLKDYLYGTYYIPLLQSWIKQRGGRRFERGLCDAMNTLYHLLVNLEYIYQIKRDQGKIYLRPLTRPISPSLKFFLAGPLILFSVNREGAITRPDYIKTALDELSLCIPVNLKDGKDSWDVARKYYLLAYRLYTGYHMIK